MARHLYSPEQVLLSELLRELRNTAGLRQTELARRLGRPQSFVSKYEAGQRRIDLIELYEICLALGVSFSETARDFEQRAGQVRSASQSV